MAGEPEHLGADVEDSRLTPDEIEDLSEAEDGVQPVGYSATDFDVEGLVRRLDRGDIVIPSFGQNDSTLEVAGFQRDFVWRRPQMDRFIESLLLGYPIPAIMLIQQSDRRYLVLDGQQRLRTLSAFYKGIHAGKEFALQNVAEAYKGLTYSTLPAELRRQLNNTFIQATIVKSDDTVASLEAVYQVFERINSGGTQLTPHEIRVALYHGTFVDLLTNLNETSEWRRLYGAKSTRLRDQELILRIIALYYDADGYERPLKKFLNEFLGRHRHLEGIDSEKVSSLFAKAATSLFSAAGKSALRYQSRQVNAALTEALFVGLMRNLDKAKISRDAIKAAVARLSSAPDMARSISGGTASEEFLKTRLRLATEAFDPNVSA